MGVKWSSALVLWVPFCVCIFGMLLAAAQTGFKICDMPGCDCTIRTAPWKIINCSLLDLQTMNLESLSIPKETVEMYVVGGQEIKFAPKTFDSLEGLNLVQINNTRRIIMEKKTFFQNKSPSLLIRTNNCDELTIKTGAFENIHSSVYIEVRNVDKYLTIETSAFSKLSEGLFENIGRLTLQERSFSFKVQGVTEKQGPFVKVSFENVVITEIPTETFSKSFANITFRDTRIDIIHNNAFKSAEISALKMINTTIKFIESGAFSDGSLIIYFEITKCNITKLHPKAITSAVNNFILNFSTLKDVESKAIIITSAIAEIVGNDILNFKSQGMTIREWNEIKLNDNFLKNLHPNFINITGHSDIRECSFQGNYIYNAELGAFNFLSEIKEKKQLIFRDNYFDRSCSCNMDEWFEGIINDNTKLKIVTDTSFCIIDEMLSKCFSLKRDKINIKNFTETFCSNFSECETNESETTIINTTSKIFTDVTDSEKQNWIILIVTVISLFILVTIITFVVLLVKGSRWLKEKGYFRNIYYNNNDLSNDDEVTTVTIDENEKLEIPNELTLEFLQLLSKRLDDPTTHQEASEMIERLYEMFVVDDSYENNNREEEAHLYEELGNLNLQIPPPPYEEEIEPAAEGARNILKLMQEKITINNDANARPSLMGDYSEPTDAAVHLYSELKHKNEKSDKDSRISSDSFKSDENPLPCEIKNNFAIEPGPSSKP